jgi:hypothetical protein
MPRLTDLEANFLRWYERAPDEDERRLNTHWPADKMLDYFQEVPTLAEAHGIMFICPKGLAAGDAHSIMVFFAGSSVPPRLGKNSKGVTVRWTASGTGLADLTLTPSVQEESGACLWHGHVTNGEAA